MKPPKQRGLSAKMKSPKAEASSDYLESSRGIGPDIQVADSVHPQGTFLERSKSAGLSFVKSSPIWILCYLFPNQASFLAWVLVLVVTAFLVMLSVLPLVRIHRKNVLELKEEPRG